MMVLGWSDEPAFGAMIFPAVILVWLIVDNNYSSLGCQWHLIKKIMHVIQESQAR